MIDPRTMVTTNEILSKVPWLVFEGLDTVCEIYLKGNLLGNADNMMIPHSFELTNINEEENEFFIHFLPVSIAARECPGTPGYYTHHPANYEMLRIRKPPHMFGWDISPPCCFRRNMASCIY